MNRSVLKALLLALIVPATAMAEDFDYTVQMFPKLVEQTGPTGKASGPVATSGKPDMHPLAPAPPLSRIVIYAVGSAQYGGWEYMTSLNQLSTVGNHGGTQLRVVVQEIGYGGTPIVRMAGNLLPNSAQYLQEAICITGSSYTSCSTGQTVVGWYRYYNVDGYQSGSFQYQNTSLNSPWNTLSTAITIK